MYKKGMHIEFTNKLSGSQYDGEITEVHSDMVVAIDDCDNVHKVPFQWWDIEIKKYVCDYCEDDGWIGDGRTPCPKCNKEGKRVD